MNRDLSWGVFGATLSAGFLMLASNRFDVYNDNFPLPNTSQRGKWMPQNKVSWIILHSRTYRLDL